MLSTRLIMFWLLFGIICIVIGNLALLLYLPSSTLLKRSFVRGEVFCLKNSCYDNTSERVRPGLQMVHKLYDYIPQIKARHRYPEPNLHSLVKKLKRDVTQLHRIDDPWKLAREWATPNSLINDNAPGLGNILEALKSAQIVRADVGYKGTQLKATLTLGGGQRAVFKPMHYESDAVIEGEICDGKDRHRGEIAAFHLSRLLNMSMVPLVVGRKVSLKNLRSVASKVLANTFIFKGWRICFYGVCHYCKKEEPVCDNGQNVEGALILWLPSHLPLNHYLHPWARTYTKNKLARWELDPNFCTSFTPLFEKNFVLLLNFVDVAIFDFLIQNGDRHHYTVVARHPNSSIILLDNGKSFGNPYVDHLDVLAPLLQCCRIRRSTYNRLMLLTGGGLSKAMSSLLSTDTLHPVISELHLQALDRRLVFILAAVAMCKDQKNSAGINTVIS